MVVVLDAVVVDVLLEVALEVVLPRSDNREYNKFSFSLVTMATVAATAAVVEDEALSLEDE